MGQGSTLSHRWRSLPERESLNSYKLTSTIKIMTFELEMALDILNGQIDKGIEFPEAIDRALKMYPVSQDELTEAYDNQ
jgi:hypothetical protein